MLYVYRLLLFQQRVWDKKSFWHWVSDGKTRLSHVQPSPFFFPLCCCLKTAALWELGRTVAHSCRFPPTGFPSPAWRPTLPSCSWTSTVTELLCRSHGRSHQHLTVSPFSPSSRRLPPVLPVGPAGRGTGRPARRRGRRRVLRPSHRETLWLRGKGLHRESYSTTTL